MIEHNIPSQESKVLSINRAIDPLLYTTYPSPLYINCMDGVVDI